jgi:serine/threonine protein kinase
MKTDIMIETVAKRTFHLARKLFSGDIADFYSAYGASHPHGAQEKVLAKIARDPRDNDLLANEIAILNALYPKGQKNEKFYRYLPRVVDTAWLPDHHLAMFLPYYEGYVSLADIIAAYPGGIDFRDMVWMYKRLLAGLGFVGARMVVHGAVLPTHVLVHPTEHGAKIIDWSYALNFAALAKPADPVVDSVPAADDKHLGRWELLRQNLYSGADPISDNPIGPPQDPNQMFVKAISVDYAGYYAPEVLRKETPSPATDIFQAAKCAVALLGGNIETNQLPPKIMHGSEGNIDPDRARTQLQAFFQGSLFPNPRKRPQDAWQVHEDFDKLLGSLVGPSKYRAFSMPGDDLATVLQ